MKHLTPTFKSFAIALFCSVFLAACAGACGDGGDMAEMEDEETSMTDTLDQTAEVMEEPAAVAAGEVADTVVAPEEEAVADVASVTGAAAGMEVATIELNVEEVKLPDYGWKLKWFGSNQINQEVGADVNLRFIAGKFGGNAGCNEYNGSYESQRGEGGEGTVKLSGMATTKKACPEGVMAVEQRYLTMFESMARFEIKKDGLYLYDAAGDWLHYVPEVPAE